MLLPIFIRVTCPYPVMADRMSAEIVAYAACQLADCLHLLCLAELLFELLILGDVSADAQYAEELALGIVSVF